MGRALVAWYEATGDNASWTPWLVYAHYPVPWATWVSSATRIVSGLCNIDPMLETYRFSGDRRVLDRVLAAVESPGVANRAARWARRTVPLRAMPCAPTRNPPARSALPGTGEQRYRQASLQGLSLVQREQHAPLWRGFGQGIPLGHRRLSPDRNLRRGRRYLVLHLALSD